MSKLWRIFSIKMGRKAPRVNTKQYSHYESEKSFVLIINLWMLVEKKEVEFSFLPFFFCNMSSCPCRQFSIWMLKVPLQGGFAAYWKGIQCVWRIFCGPSRDFHRLCLLPVRSTCQVQYSQTFLHNLPAENIILARREFVVVLSKRRTLNCLLVFSTRST